MIYKKYRKDKKLDQRHIAELTGLDQAIISKYENKKYVTQYVTDTLLYHIPELESYMINESDQISDHRVDYTKDRSKDQKLIESIFEMIRNNEKLIDNNSKLVEINASLSNFILNKLKNNGKELNHAG